MSEDTQSTDAPTATEFIPADENGVRDDTPAGVRHLQATGDGGVEIVSEEPADDDVKNHVFICDECGHDEPTEDGIGHHLEHNH